MTKSDIVHRLADGTGLTKLETEAVVDGFLYLLTEAVCHGDGVELRGFGSFKAGERAPRMARNPRTDEQIEVPRRFVPTFRPAAEFKRAVNAARIGEGSPADEAQGGG